MSRIMALKKAIFLFTVHIGPDRHVSPLPADLDVHILCNHPNSILLTNPEGGGNIFFRNRITT
jgi:hypothetical protein